MTYQAECAGGRDECVGDFGPVEDAIETVAECLHQAPTWVREVYLPRIVQRLHELPAKLLADRAEEIAAKGRRLAKRREYERRRYQRIKADPERFAAMRARRNAADRARHRERGAA